MPENPSAFPVVDTHIRNPRVGNPYPAVTSVGGMTLRDYFAAAALPTAIEHELQLRSNQILPPPFRYDQVAKSAYLVADAMLVERERSK